MYLLQAYLRRSSGSDYRNSVQLTRLSHNPGADIFSMDDDDFSPESQTVGSVRAVGAWDHFACSLPDHLARVLHFITVPRSVCWNGSLILSPS